MTICRPASAILMWVPYVSTDELRCPSGVTGPPADSIHGAGQQVQCTAGQAYDGDYLADGSPPPDLLADTFNLSGAYTWTSSIGGTFQSSGNGSTATWTVPNSYGTVTLTCTIKDDANDLQGVTGTSRADYPIFPLTKTRNVYVVSCYANTDSNNNGTIDPATDDSIEETAPGRYVAVNNDDDNNNTHPDNSATDDTTVAGENDLAQVNIGYNAGSANINGYKLYITCSSGIRLWTNSTKGTEITSGANYEIGVATIPSQIHVEGMTTGENTLTVTLKNGATEVTHDTVLFTVEDMVHEVTYLDPSGTVGGKFPVRAQVRTRYSALSQLTLKERENNTNPTHTTDWTSQGSMTFVSSSVSDRITTAIYKLNWNSVGDTSNGQVGLHNGTHELKAEATFTGNMTDDDTGTITTNNLVITTCDPESVVCWNGEEETTVPIEVNLSDNDLANDPVTLELKIYATNVDNRSSWPVVRTMTATGVTSSQYTFNWDGMNDSSQPVDPWTYTFEVKATQTDVNNDDSSLTVSDAASYRSKYLSIIRATDENGQPIFEPEFAGYDDNETPDDDTDDNFLYYIRPYVLKDTGDLDANEGVISLYDPDLDNIASWNVANLPCRQHNDAHDGLDADSAGIRHDVLMKVPIGAMQKPGTYRFVLHVKDNHELNYRDHDKRFALNLNAAATKPIFTSIGFNYPDGYFTECMASVIAGFMKISGYAAETGNPVGNPHGGATGVLLNISSHEAIHTLGRICYQCPVPGVNKPVAKTSAIWAFFGHSSHKNGQCPLFFYKPYIDPDPVFTNSYLYASEIEPYSVMSNETNLDHVRLAYLEGCFTAGGEGDNKGDYVNIAKNQSVARKFYAKGADCVVGFEDFVYPFTSALPTFRVAFFSHLSAGKKTGDAFALALEAAYVTNIGLTEEQQKAFPIPVIWGANTKIVPAKYGENGNP